MPYKILFADDEGALLQVAEAQPRNRYDVRIARSAKEAMTAIVMCGPYAAIVSDICFPGTDDATFLMRAAELVPSTPKVAVAANDDIQAAFDAVTKGHAFCVLAAPCNAAIGITVATGRRHSPHVPTTRIVRS